MSQALGICLLCGEWIERGLMTRHLGRCGLEETSRFQPTSGKAQPTPAFHLFVEGRYENVYWLHLGAPVTASLARLDHFLRHIWLECCGHMSAFKIKDRYYACSPMGGGEENEMSLATPLDQVLKVGTRFFYDYDFGSTTHLALKVVALRKQGTVKDAIELLARNQPPEIHCWRCGQPAIMICSQCVDSGKGCFCRQCIAAHRCGEEMYLPVVNSPRAGVCGYTG